MTGLGSSPLVVCIGGGHGLAVTLRAVAPWAGKVTAVVSTADDGGSTGRLRESWHVPALGDVRRCLSALAAPDDVWTRVLERRFDAGELAGHAVGNLVLLALTEELGDLQSACDEVARTLGIDLDRARVVPVTDDVVVLHGRTHDGSVVAGQVAVAETSDLAEVWVDPGCTAASVLAIEAIRMADLVVLGPGSLYTSVLAAAVVGDVRKALVDTGARVVYVANLRAEQAEAKGYDLTAHLQALGLHGVRSDVVISHPGGAVSWASRPEPISQTVATGRLANRAWDVVEADVADSSGLVHDPAKLGAVLAGLDW